MIFGCRTFTGPEAVEVGLVNRSVPKKELRKTVVEYCEKIKSFSSQTLRQTKRSLNFESDQLYASWQHGMELLAHVWGQRRVLRGHVCVSLEKRKPDFQKFRQRNKEELDAYLSGLRRGVNKPAIQEKSSKEEKASGEEESDEEKNREEKNDEA